MPLTPGQILNNRYRIVRLLGQGGFGAVYRAWDTNLNRPCAVKENLDVSPEAQRQFTREATVLANLSHSNLTRVTDHFILPGQGQYLVMDFVEGEDLASVVKRQGQIPPEQALEWMDQVADALNYLHNRQPPVVHRDVKPANIRLTPDGRAMLVDFGLVKLYDAHLHTTLGARAVTPGYAPPEQYGQGKTDSRTDQYALAATLYNLLTAQEPMESVQRMAGGQMPLAHQVNPRVNPAVSMTMERAMRLEPSQRFGTVQEFKQALTASSLSGTAARQPQDVYVRPASPVAATQMAPSMPAASNMSAGNLPVNRSAAQPIRAQAAGGTARPAQPRPTTGGVRASSIGAAGAVIAVVCIGLFILAAVLISNGQRSAQQTADAQLQATLNERVRITSTAQSIATQTAAVMAQATEQAKGTVDARITFLATLDSSKTLVFGPASGNLTHKPDDGLIETYYTGVNLRDFIVEARFFNPYSPNTGAWDHGFLLRSQSDQTNAEFRFVIFSDRSWLLLNTTGDADKSEEAASGSLPTLNINDKESNLVRLIFQGGRGFFFLNGEYVDEFDLSSRMNSGDIILSTGIYKGDEIAGYSTPYSEFSVWSLP